MPRHCRYHRRPGRRWVAGLRSRLASLLWLVTALSVLQWAAPSVDAALFQRLLTQGGGEAGLASGDRASPAVIEGRAAASVVFVEKRSQSSRLPWHAGGDAGLAGSPSAPAPVPAIATVVAARADAIPRPAAHGFSARGPPAV